MSANILAHVPFAVCPINILMSSQLSHAERATWSALAVHAGGPRNPYARPSVATLSRISGYCERQVRRSLRSLEEMGAIATYRELPGRPREYWLHFAFDQDNPEFLALMRERAERNADPIEGVREMEQVELALFAEAEQLSFAVETPDIQRPPEPSLIQPSDPPPQPEPPAESEPPPTTEPELTLRAGRDSLSLSTQDLAGLAAEVERQCPVFDGKAGRPPAREIIEQALCARWLGRRFRLDLKGVRAHCVAYARVEAKTRWKAESEALAAPTVVTRAPSGLPARPTLPPPSQALPPGGLAGLVRAFRHGGTEAVNAALAA